MALNEEQVRKYNLPPQIAKKSDPRHSGFEKQHGLNAVELDALPPSILRELISEAILRKLNVASFNSDIFLRGQGSPMADKGDGECSILQHPAEKNV